MSERQRTLGLPYPPLLDCPAAAESLQQFLREELRKSGLDGFVVGLSGGVDSALACALAVRAVGPEHIHAVKMPYRTSSPSSQAHADLVASSLGLQADRTDISPMVDAYFEGRPDASALRRGNYMARVRMACLFDLSMAHRALVLGTGNKTEILLGYGTWYGDTACSLNPNGDLYKSQVWQLSRHLGLPVEVVEKAPSADLWPDQTDEGEMGLTYAEADAVLYLTVDAGLTADEVASRGFGRDRVAKILGMMERSAFKRRLPAIAEISQRPVGRDS